MVRKARAQDVDRHIGRRMKERRVLLGLTQQQMAELIGVTYQQAHKYEKGINRTASGRLFDISNALGVPVTYFFEGLDLDRPMTPTPGGGARRTLELARHFQRLTPSHQDALCALARTLDSAD